MHERGDVEGEEVVIGIERGAFLGPERAGLGDKGGQIPADLFVREGRVLDEGAGKVVKNRMLAFGYLLEPVGLHLPDRLREHRPHEFPSQAEPSI
jgi:hypothetical protein